MGKSSVVVELGNDLRRLGLNVYTTREPGGTEIGNAIQDIVHNAVFGEMDTMAEQLPYQASRAQIIAQEIIPRLKLGQIVLVDRYVDSSLRGLSCGKVHFLSQLATRGIEPDLTFLLDLKAEIGLARKKKLRVNGIGWRHWVNIFTSECVKLT